MNDTTGTVDVGRVGGMYAAGQVVATVTGRHTTPFPHIDITIERPHLRSRLPTMWSRLFFVATVGRVSEDTIRRYIDEQTTRPTKGRP